ncbi:MAG: Gfo/Idh/MocA family protein, partial [Sedimentitalea sp.]
RLEAVKLLADAGKPILMEKPIERDLPTARALVEMCEAQNVPLGVVFQHRMRPAARQLAALDLGPIASVEVSVPWWRDAGYYASPGRGTYARDGGGVLITQAIHTLDLMLHLCGPVAAVQALCASTSLHDIEAEDFASAGMVFRSGAVGSMMASTASFPGRGEQIVINAQNASAVLNAAELTIYHQDGRVEQIGAAAATGGGADPMAFTADWHRDVIADFAQALRDRRAPAITGRDALGVHALIDAIQTSSRTGAKTQVKQDPYDD